ncbi:unnamed protein product [Penicillium olsonii]|nr:unnamed protein product [Penicillium olsonii]
MTCNRISHRAELFLSEDRCFLTVTIPLVISCPFPPHLGNERVTLLDNCRSLNLLISQRAASWILFHSFIRKLQIATQPWTIRSKPWKAPACKVRMVAIPHCLISMDNLPPTLDSLQRRVTELTAAYHSRGWTTEATDLETAIETAGKRILADTPDPATITLEELSGCVRKWLCANSWIVAEDLGILVLQTCESLKGERDPMTMTAMNNLVAAHLQRGQLDQAAALSLRVTNLRQNLLGETHPQTLASMTNLASTYRRQGRWEEAQKLDAHTVKLKTTAHGPWHSSTLTSISNLANSYAQVGRYEEAASIIRQLIDDAEKHGIPQTNPSLLNWKLTLASTYRDQGQFGPAEKLERDVVAISLNESGAHNSFTLTCMANLASTYREQGRWVEAERLEKEVVANSEKILGETHPQTLKSIGNLASTYRSQGRLEEATKLGKKVTAVMTEVLGERHADTLVAMADLAVTYQMNHQPHDAEVLAARSLHLMKETIGENHPHTLSAMANLGYIYQSQSKWDIAGGMAETVHARREQTIGKDHPDTLAALEDLRRVAWVEAADQNAQSTLN